MNRVACLLACAVTGCAGLTMKTAAPPDVEIVTERIESVSAQNSVRFVAGDLTFDRVDRVRWKHGETSLAFEVRHEPGPVADVRCRGRFHEAGRDAKCTLRVLAAGVDADPGDARVRATNGAMVVKDDADAEADAVLILGASGTRWTARPVQGALPVVQGYDLFSDGLWVGAVDLRGTLHFAAFVSQESRVVAGAMAAVLLWLPGTERGSNGVDPVYRDRVFGGGY